MKKRKRGIRKEVEKWVVGHDETENKFEWMCGKGNEGIKGLRNGLCGGGRGGGRGKKRQKEMREGGWKSVRRRAGGGGGEIRGGKDKTEDCWAFPFYPRLCCSLWRCLRPACCRMTRQYQHRQRETHRATDEKYISRQTGGRGERGKGRSKVGKDWGEEEEKQRNRKLEERALGEEQESRIVGRHSGERKQGKQKKRKGDEGFSESDEEERTGKAGKG